jgi:hypothetical protein
MTTPKCCVGIPRLHGVSRANLAVRAMDTHFAATSVSHDGLRPVDGSLLRAGDGTCSLPFRGDDGPAVFALHYVSVVGITHSDLQIKR